LEALAPGLPVVTTKTNGGSELIDDGVQGTILSAPDDPDCVAEALGYWLEPTRRAETRLVARKRAEEHPLEHKLRALEDCLKKQL